MLLNLLRSGNSNTLTVIMYILSILLTVFLVLPLHECAHGFVAHKLGDDTAKREGRITLNPLVHIDYMGAALMLLIGFGWAKPVPVDARKFKNPKVGMALSALAGPVSNLIAAIVAGLIQNALILMVYKQVLPIGPQIAGNSLMAYVVIFFEFLITVNIGLAVFNFLPIPPLDGSKIMMAFLPDKAIIWIYQREQYISIALFVIIMMGGFNGILGAADNIFYKFISWLTWLPYGWAV